MASWGTGLYQDDVAEDVKNDYLKLLTEGRNNEEVYDIMLSQYEEIIKDKEDQSVFWLALADTMWNFGKLTEEVKRKALYYIENGQDVEKWKAEDENNERERQIVLEKLKEKLKSPMPAERNIQKKRKFKNKWELGDMYLVPIMGEYPRFPEMKVKYLLLIKIGDRIDLADHVQPVVYVKYLKEEYHDGIDINQLIFAPVYDDGFRFVISGIAGKPTPKELTYAGNFGDLANLKLPQQELEEVKEINCNCMWRVSQLEQICVFKYLTDIIGVDKKECTRDTIHLKPEEYEKYCLLK